MACCREHDPQGAIRRHIGIARRLTLARSCQSGAGWPAALAGRLGQSALRGGTRLARPFYYAARAACRGLRRYVKPLCSLCKGRWGRRDVYARSSCHDYRNAADRQLRLMLYDVRFDDLKCSFAAESP